MSNVNILDPGGYRPGNRVRVLLGKAMGLQGKVVSAPDAQVLWRSCGLRNEAFAFIPGQVCVRVRMLGVPVPLSLDIANIKLDALA